jgi:hypothetical protein
MFKSARRLDWLLIISAAACLRGFGQAPASSSPTATTKPTGTANKCELLAELALPNTKIAAAQAVAAGAFTGPTEAFTGRDLTPFYKSLPAFCRVVAHAHPTTDSDIKIEIWLPLSSWNGRLQGIGNGGFAGLIDYHQLGTGILQRDMRLRVRMRATPEGPQTPLGRWGILRK